MTMRWPRVISTILFYAGAALCLSFLQSILGTAAVLVAAAIVTTLALGASRTSSARRPVRVLAWIARAGVIALHLLWAYFLVTWGTHLAWTTPWWARAAALALLALAAVTFRRPPERVRVPLALPMGAWIAACLAGWLREEGFARCDDSLRLRAQAGVELVLPTLPELASCKAGDVLPIDRYPRKTWESPDGARYVMTTQRGIRFDGATTPRGAFYELFCEAPADGSAAPHCVGGTAGKSHGIQEIAPLDQLFIGAWGLKSAEGKKQSALFRVPRGRSIEVLQETRFDGSVGDGFYSPKSDVFYLFNDECAPLPAVRGADFARLPDAPVGACPGESRYDPARDEGVWCGGLDSLAVAFRGSPFTHREIARSDNPLARVSLSWGCDWDPERRRVYTAIPNLGLLATIDYDTGRVLRQDFVGFALRSVAFDAPRRRAYLADFLGGDVVAVDVGSGREVARWFAGRYVREVRVARDGKTLLATSNLGLARIRLDAR